MPPSGFNKKAIDGLLRYVHAKYDQLLTAYNQQEKSESEFLEETISELESKVTEDSPNNGLKVFVVECYKDLVKEIYAGKDKQNRPVTNGQAIKKEINQINDYLTTFKI